MSTLQVETIKNPTSSNTVNSEQLVQGSATAWVNFNGSGTVAIRDSYNVSSITDNGTGRYSVNFATIMENDNYAMSAALNHQINATARIIHEDHGIIRSVSSISVHCGYISSSNNYTLYDHSNISTIVHGGK